MIFKGLRNNIFIISVSCKDVNTVDLKRAVSANDCLKAVKEANHFTSTNVIYMQYVLDTIGFGGLSEKCVEYAKGQDALCYHKVQTGNAFHYLPWGTFLAKTS